MVQSRLARHLIQASDPLISGYMSRNLASRTPVLQDAVNFAVFSSSARSVELCLFDEQSLRSGRVLHSITLDPVANKTGDIWHIQLPHINNSLLYGEQ